MGSKPTLYAKACMAAYRLPGAECGSLEHLQHRCHSGSEHSPGGIESYILDTGPKGTGSGGITEIRYLVQQSPDRTYPIGITTGPDGVVWFAERGLGRLASITTYGQFRLPVS